MDLKVEGTEEFKKQTVMAALKMGLQVTFDDPRMNAELERLRGERQENRERGKSVTGRWAKEKAPERQQEQEIKVPQPERKKDRDYER